MRRTLPNKQALRTSSLLVIIALSIVGVGLFSVQRAESASMGQRSLMLSNSIDGMTNVMYDLLFTTSTAGTLGSVKIEFCSNSSLIDDVCVAPNGLDVSNAQLASVSGVGDFVIAPAGTTANTITLTRSPDAVSPAQIDASFTDIANPSDAGSYFVKITTYASDDASGSYIDNGGIAFSINPALSVSTEVPPFLIFCLGNSIPANDCSSAQGNYVNVGDMGPTYTSSGQTELLTATNAGNGYGISVLGATMTSGNNEISVILPGGQSVAGISQFGINLRSNTNPDVGQSPSGPGHGTPTLGYNMINRYRFISGDVIASSPTADDYRRYTVSYIINVSANQPPGVYTSTFTYICLANF